MMDYDYNYDCDSLNYDLQDLIVNREISEEIIKEIFNENGE